MSTDTLNANVTRLRLRAGDTLVLQVERPLSADQRAHVFRYLSDRLPHGVRTLLVDMPAKLTVLEDANGLFGDADAEAVLDAAGDRIWHSIRKFDGDPSRVDFHAITCGCTECN